MARVKSDRKLLTIAGWAHVDGYTGKIGALQADIRNMEAKATADIEKIKGRLAEDVKTAQDANAPIYQWPGIDLIFESVLPFEFVDHHHWQYDLEPVTDEDPQLLIDRARSLREQTQNMPQE